MTDTGLPELPSEDMFFRVNPKSVELRAKQPDSEWSRYHPGINYSWNVPGPPSTAFEVESRVVTETVKGPWYLFGAKREVEVREYRKVNYSFRLTDERAEDDQLPLTREAVIELANKVLEKFRQGEVTRALLGDYPPKKLEDS